MVRTLAPLALTAAVAAALCLPAAAQAQTFGNTNGFTNNGFQGNGFQGNGFQANTFQALPQQRPQPGQQPANPNPDIDWLYQQMAPPAPPAADQPAVPAPNRFHRLSNLNRDRYGANGAAVVNGAALGGPAQPVNQAQPFGQGQFRASAQAYGTDGRAVPPRYPRSHSLNLGEPNVGNQRPGARPVDPPGTPHQVQID